jgi:hypothetical protein
MSGHNWQGCAFSQRKTLEDSVCTYEILLGIPNYLRRLRREIEVSKIDRLEATHLMPNLALNVM